MQAQNIVRLSEGDIQSLQFSDDSFDRVVIEAVTMFVDQPRAVHEVVRVCRPNGRVLDHEFIYRAPPPSEARSVFENEVCGGVRFHSADEWIDLYRTAGLTDIQHLTGPFAMMTPMGMWRDEGVYNLFAMMGRVMTRPAYLRKMSWLMSRILRVKSYLGYVVLAGTKPASESEHGA